jgi:hypothetical protein
MANSQLYHVEEIFVLSDSEDESYSHLNGLNAQEIAEISRLSEVPVDGSCCICLLDFEGDATVRQLVCKHSFHEDCLLRWLQTNITCPLCRHRLTDRPTYDEFAEMLSSDSETDEEAPWYHHMHINQPNPQLPTLPRGTGFGFPVPPVQISSLAETVGSMSMSSSSEDFDEEDFFGSTNFVDEGLIGSATPAATMLSDESDNESNTEEVNEQINFGTANDMSTAVNLSLNWAEEMEREEAQQEAEMMSIDESETEDVTMDISLNVNTSYDLIHSDQMWEQTQSC